MWGAAGRAARRERERTASDCHLFSPNLPPPPPFTKCNAPPPVVCLAIPPLLKGRKVKVFMGKSCLGWETPIQNRGKGHRSRYIVQCTYLSNGSALVCLKRVKCIMVRMTCFHGRWAVRRAVWTTIMLWQKGRFLNVHMCLLCNIVYYILAQYI